MIVGQTDNKVVRSVTYEQQSSLNLTQSSKTKKIAEVSEMNE